MYILWYKPLDSRRANLTEVFNDVTLLLLTYLLWCFTDWIREPETRHNLGFVFIGVSLGNICTHLITMLVETAIKTKLRYK